MIMDDALKQYFGVAQVVPAGRASLGIFAALRVWSGGQKIKVALSAAVCQDVIAAVLMADCIPVFCDIDVSSGLVTEREWQRARARGASAAIVIHLYGNPADTSATRHIFTKPDCLVIDDAAQALGANTSTGLAGTEGDVGIISFGRTKHITVGGGALFFHDAKFARECECLLKNTPPASDADIQVAVSGFRARFQTARTRLIETGTADGFANLLDGYEPTLRVAWRAEWATGIAAAFARWPSQLTLRKRKAAHWQQKITGTGLIPVGMGAGSSPWRYSCRLPGCSWYKQHSLGENMRKLGLNVSHWYLPGHWLLGEPIGSLPGVERLAHEVFQFWLDDGTSMSMINQAKPVLLSCLT